MDKVFTKSLVYSNFLQVLKVVVLKFNGKPVRYYSIPSSTKNLNDYAKDISYHFGTELDEGYTIKAIGELQMNSKASIEINTNKFTLELIDGKEFDELYVCKD